jgi:hypothetical protein
MAPRQNVQTALRWTRFAGGLHLVLTAALLMVVLGVLLVPVAHAATINVTTTSDALDAAGGICANMTPLNVTTTGDGKVSLREAICAANNNTGADIINLPADTYTLTIVGAFENSNVQGDLDILAAGGDLTIDGAGAGISIIDGDGVVINDRVFHIAPYGGSITVNISGVTIQNGNTGGGGGGILNVGSGTVNITNSTLSGNQAAGLGGGGIGNTKDGGTVNITNSTLSANQTTADGGGIYNDDGGTVNITNSTLSGNQATGGGGGIFNASTVTMKNVTIADNAADDDGNGTGDGGGVYNFSGGTVNLKNTIVAANSDETPVPGSIHPDVSGAFSSNGYNLIGDGTGSSGLINGVNGDQVGASGSPIDPVLGPLTNNGGDTFTHALLVGSPAIDAGTNTGCPTTDQRDEPRPADGDGDGTATCDIGAFEFQWLRIYLPIIFKGAWP